MNEVVVVPEISDDALISAWVVAMHGYISTGNDDWEFRRQMLLDELYRRKLGRKMFHVMFDQASFNAVPSGEESKPH